MRTWVVVALFTLFYFTSFPSLTLTDLAIISLLALVGGVLAAKTLFKLSTRLVEEAYSTKIDSFISTSWAVYRNHGFNRDMTYRLAKCFIVIVCVKYGFDVVKHAAEHVPAVHANAYWAEVIGAIIVVGFAFKEGVWLRWASNFRRDFQRKARLSFATFYRLYTRPVTVCCAVLYAPALVRLCVAGAMHGVRSIAPQSPLFAAPMAQCVLPVVN